MGQWYGGQRGPRSTERKSWQAELKKPLWASLVMALLWPVLWGLISLGLSLYDRYNPWIVYFGDHWNHWWLVVVIGWTWIGFMLLAKVTETFWDDDFTTLLAKHPWVGILPMRPVWRIILAIWIWRQEPNPVNSDNDTLRREL